MDRRLDWIASNGVLAAGLYFAIVAQVGWAQYAITAFTWWMLANCATALIGGLGSRPLSLPTVAAAAGDDLRSRCPGGDVRRALVLDRVRLCRDERDARC